MASAAGVLNVVRTMQSVAATERSRLRAAGAARPPMTPPGRDPLLSRLERDSLLVAVALSVAAAGLWPGRPGRALGVLGGFALIAVSYRGIRAGVDGLWPSYRPRRGAEPPENRGGFVKFLGMLYSPSHTMMARFSSTRWRCWRVPASLPPSSRASSSPAMAGRIQGLRRRRVLSTRSILSAFVMLLVAGLVSPVYAQDAGATNTALVQWSIITAGFALAIAALGGALGQGRAVASATEAIARNPGAAGEIRGALILGLVLIESLVIYAAHLADPVLPRRSAVAAAVSRRGGSPRDLPCSSARHPMPMGRACGVR
jgi:F-type H+-transporting ATPase subunit c